MADAVARNTTCLIGQLSSRECMSQEHRSLVRGKPVISVIRPVIHCKTCVIMVIMELKRKKFNFFFFILMITMITHVLHRITGRITEITGFMQA